MTLPFSRSPHLVALIAEVERLATRLATAAPGNTPSPRTASSRSELRRTRGLEAARASLLLDGARTATTLDPDAATATATRVLDEADAEVVVAQPGRATWLDTLPVLADPEEELVAALELLGVLAADDSDDLIPMLLTDADAALTELHRRLTRGLVAPERVGVPRTLDQAVHDGATGRIVFRTTRPEDLPRELGLLGAWLASTGSREHGLIASGVLQAELLRLHPFDAANGRLARAAARLVLRHRDLDPDHLAVPEVAQAADLLGYHEELARTLLRRDLTIWLERWAEAVAEGLRGSARAVGAVTAEPDPRAVRFVRATPTFTITELRAELSAGPEAARVHVDALLDAGLIARVPASRGLRFTAGSGEDTTSIDPPS